MGMNENIAQRVAGHQLYTNHSGAMMQRYSIPSAVAPPVVSKKKTKANTLTDKEREIIRQRVLTPELEQSALARSKVPVADKIVCPTCGPGDREISSKVSKSKTAHCGSKIHRECWDARQGPWKKAFSEWAPPCPANVDSASNALSAAAPAVKTVAKSGRGGKKRKADEDLDNAVLGSSVSAVAVSAPSRDFKAIRKRQKLVVQSALASNADVQPQVNDTAVADRNAPDDDGDNEDFLKDAFDDEVSTVQADRDVLDVDDDNDDDNDDDDDDDFLEGQIEEVSAGDLGQLSRASTETLVSTQDQIGKTLADGEPKHAIAGTVEEVFAASLPSAKDVTAEEGEDTDDDLEEVVVEPCLKVNKDATAEGEDPEDDEDEDGDWEEVVPGQVVALEVNENIGTVHAALQETLVQTRPVVESGHLKNALVDAGACSIQSVGGTSVNGDEDEDEDESESDVEPTEDGAVEDSSSDDSEDSDED